MEIWVSAQKFDLIFFNRSFPHANIRDLTENEIHCGFLISVAVLSNLFVCYVLLSDLSI